MPTGFIYVVTTVTADYEQIEFCNVPTYLDDRLYFGPCKRPMRRRMNAGDYVFGISPASTRSRRIVFVGQIEESMSFADAYRRYPNLRGPDGPIHVKPIDGVGTFPQSSYQHIPRSMHPAEWKSDLASPELDRFFVCTQSNGWLGSWLGANGPVIDDEILDFIKTCSVHGPNGQLSAQNKDATMAKPVRYGGLFTGLHLETNRPVKLVALCNDRLSIESDGMVSGLSRVTPVKRSKVPCGRRC